MTVNTKIIKLVKFKNPELFDKNAAAEIKNRFNNLELNKSDLSAKRMEIYKLEDIIQKEELELSKLRPLLIIEYETKEIIDKKFGECNILINNPTDARNL